MWPKIGLIILDGLFIAIFTIVVSVHKRIYKSLYCNNYRIMLKKALLISTCYYHLWEKCNTSFNTVILLIIFKVVLSNIIADK